MAEIIESIKHDSIESSLQSKTKRSKNDAVKNAVALFLKKRNYADIDVRRKTTSELTISKEQLAVSLLTDKDAARFNSITYSSISNDAPQVAQHYLKWLEWVSNLRCGRHIQSQLWTLARPLLCHLHLEALRGDHRTDHSTLLCLHQEYKKAHEAYLNENIDQNSKEDCPDISLSILDKLSKISTTQDIESFPPVMMFRSCKYKIQLSPQALRILTDYLSKYSHVIMLQVLQTWFDIEVVLEPNDQTLDNNSFSAAVPAEGDYVGNTSREALIPEGTDMDSTRVKAKLQELEDSIAEFDKKPPNILLVTISNEQNKCSITNSSANTEMTYLAAGFSNSAVHVWSRYIPLTKLYQNNASLAVPSISDDSFQVRDTEDRHHTVLRGHSDVVQDVGFSPATNMPVLFSVSHDTTMRAWDLRDCSCKAIYRGHNYPIWCWDISTLGMYIATGSQDRTVRLWTPECSHPLRICAGHNLDINCVKFHSNGLYVASGSSDRTVRLWNVSDGNLVRLMPLQRGVHALAFSSDGKYLATGGDDKRVYIWDLATGSQVTKLRSHTDIITTLNWHDGTLASGSLDGTVRLWDATSATQQGHSGSIEPVEVFNTGCDVILKLQTVADQLLCIGVKSPDINS